MKKLLLLLFTLPLFGQLFSQTTTAVFLDNFNRAALSPGGTPSVTYTNTNTGTGTGAGASINYTPATSTGFLQISNGTSGTLTSGRSWTTAPLNYSAPFSPTLAANPGLVTWTFNAGSNRSSTSNPSFSSGSYAMAVVLAANNTDLLNTANGYAVVYGGSGGSTGVREYKLVKFAGGLNSNANVTSIISTGASQVANLNAYVSIKVTYDPNTNNWSLYFRDDASTSTWQDPAAGTLTQVGTSVQDATYTTSALSVFGFFWNYSTSTDNQARFDNYQVTVVQPATFYYKGSGDLHTFSSWSNTSDLTGTPPGSFTAPNQSFIIGTNATTTAAWTVSGLGSKIVLGNGTSGITLTDNFGITGLITITGANNLVLNNSTTPTIGSVVTGSTVDYAASTAQTISAANYSNLTSSGSGPRTLAATGTIGVSGTFNPGVSNTYTNTGSTISFNGSTQQSIPAFAYNILNINNSSAAALTTTSGAVSIPAATSGEVSIASGLTITTGNLFVNDTLANTATSTTAITSSAATLGFGATGVYNYNGTTGGQIPAATWTPTSTVNITKLVSPGTTGVSAGTPGTSGYGSINFDNPSLVSNAYKLFGGFNTAGFTIQGNLTLGRTGTATYIQMTTSAQVITVLGNVNVYAGNYGLNSYASTEVLSITGDLNIDATNPYGSTTGYTAPRLGISMTGSSSGGTGTINLKGNLKVTAGANLYQNAGVATVNFIGADAVNPQQISGLSGANVSGVINYTVTKPAGSVVLLNAFDIYGSLTLTASTMDFADNLVTLKSLSAAVTGRIADINTSTLKNASNVTMERMLPLLAGSTQPSYRYLSHPFKTGRPISELKDNIIVSGPDATLDQNPGSTTSSAYHFNPAYTDPAGSDAYIGFATASDQWLPGEGIAVLNRGPRPQTSGQPAAVTIDVNGAVDTGTQVLTIPASTFGFGLVGNPLPSQVNMNATTRSNLTSGFYVWDLSLGTETTTEPRKSKGGFRAVTYASAYTLQSSQAIFVELSNKALGGSITFPEASKVATAPADVNAFRTSAINNMNIQLETGSILWDRMEFVFDDATSTAKEYIDVNKYRNPQVSLFSYSSDGKELAIDNRPVGNNSVIALGMTNLITGSYTIRATEMNLPSNLTAYIKDKFNGNSLAPLVNGGTFNFTVTSNAASAAVDRFEIVFAPAAPLPVSLTNVVAYTKNSGVQVDWTFSSEMNMNSYEVERSANGLQFSNIGTVASRGNSSVATNYTLFDASPIAGANYYRIKIIDKNGQSTFSRVVRVNIGSGKPAISVYPNPVVDNIISVQMDNLAKADYTITLSNKLGQLVASKVVNHAGGSASQTLQVNNLATGVYQLKVTGTDYTATQQIIKK